MACEPFDCDECGERHTRCSAHIIKCPIHGNELRRENKVVGAPCVACGTPLVLGACPKWPRKQTSVCQAHGGNAPNVVAAVERKKAMQQARADAERLGQPMDMDPGDALLQGVKEWAGNVHFYRTLVESLEPGMSVTVPDPTYDGTRNMMIEGIYNLTFHQSGKLTGEAKPHVLVVLYKEAWDMLRQFSEAALRAGVEERRLRIEEATVRSLWQAAGGAIADAELSDEQVEKFRQGFARRLREAALQA